MTDFLFEDPRKVLARHNLAPKKAFSQNFLTSSRVVEGIVHALDLTPGEQVIELGPGLGTLTQALLHAEASVIAVERDRDMIEVLGKEFANRRLQVVEGDAATVSLTSLAPDAHKLAGNLPYAVTGAIVRNLIAHRTQFERAVIMVQREVQERLVSPEGSKHYGALSVFVAAQFRAKRVLKVPAGCFHPAPKVDSAVVELRRLASPRAEETPTFRSVVKAAFGQRRKTLRNALKATGHPKDILEACLGEAAIDGRRRGETLAVEEFRAIADALDARLLT